MEQGSNWQQHIDEWQRSGLSQQDYCRSHGISLASFGYWRRKLKRNDPAKPRFYPLVVSAERDAGITSDENSGLRVLLGRFAIEIGDRFSPAVLQRLVSTLEQLR